jgi:hypothetical protein
LPTKAPRQGELKDEAQDMQAKAASPSPEAASSLGEAASQMQKSQNSLARQQNNAPAQQAAVDALQRAEQQLVQDLARLEQAEKDLAHLEEMLKKLVALIEEQQRVQLGTAQQAVRTEPEIEPTQALGARQTALATNTAALQVEAAPLVPPAAAYLDEAQRQMQGAKGELEKRAPKSAQPPQAAALAALYRAKKEFENKMDDLRDKLGLPSGENMDALAEAQRRIEEAQKQVSDAQEQLQQAPPGLIEALQKQQQEIAASLNELRQDAATPETFAPAEQAANEAARQLGLSDLPAAIDAMKSAQKGIQQAARSNATPPPATRRPSVADVGKKQADVQKAAEALVAMQQNAPASAMQAAAEAMQNANNAINPITAGALGQMPAGAQSSLQSAQGSTAQGSAQAAAGQNGNAQRSAAEAAQALAQAQAALALAQAGVGSEAAMGQPGQGQGQSQGKGQGQGKGAGQARANAQGQGQGQPSPQGTGNQGNWSGTGGADGQRAGAGGGTTFTRLPNRDRAALQQSQAEKYPQEYGPLVEQYLRNLSDQGGEK